MRSAAAPVATGAGGVMSRFRRIINGLRAPETLDLLLVAGLVVVVLAPLLGGGWTETHEKDSYLLRVFALDQALADGQRSIRWMPLMSQGYGYPFFNFYAPLVFVVAEAFHLLGLAITASLVATVAMATLASGACMYLLVRDVWGRGAGIVAAAAYVLAPYHILNLYWRGAIAEYVAGALFPVILLALRRFLVRGRPAALVAAGLSYAALLFTHNVSALLFTGLLAGYVAVEAAARRPGLARFGAAAGAMLAGLAIGAAFWVPAFFERDLVQIGRALTDWFDYHQHFVAPATLVASVGDLSEAGRGVGVFVLAGTVLAPFLAFGRWRDGRALFAFMAIAGALAAFAVSPQSAWLWDRLPLLHFLQFPWRLLMIVSLCGAVASAAAVQALPGGGEAWRRLAPYGVVLLVVLLDAWFLGIYRHADVDEGRLTAAHFLAETETTTFGEFTPVGVAHDPARRARDAAVAAGDAEVRSEERRGLRIAADVTARGEATVRLSHFWFPGWRVLVDGEEAEAAPDDGGLITVRVPAGDHRVETAWVGTPVERAADWMSAAGIVALAALAFAWRRWGRSG